jgi:hypothetical protein
MSRRRRKKKKISPEDEVFLWNKDNPADRAGKPLVWNPEDTLTNVADRGMNPPNTEYENRGKFFPKEHDRDSTEDD